MFDDILVPTDDSDCARVAVEYAADLAPHFGATIHVLSAVDPRRLDNAPHYEQRCDELGELTARVGTELGDAGITVEQAVRTELPHRAILEYAAENEIDLVVMGTHGRTGVDRYLLGSETEKVLRNADAPVLTVRLPEDDVSFPYEDVLVPTDGSDGATAAVDPAIAIATTYDATLHALSVVDTRSLGIDVRSADIITDLEETAQDAVDAVTARTTEASVAETESVIEHGLPFEAIQSYVEANDIDLVVMGTHGRSGIPRYLLGSVAEKLVRTSPAPVMTVRPPRGETE